MPRRPDDGWHRRANDAAAKARKHEYNSRAYKDAKAVAQRAIDAGRAYCWRCGRWLPPGKPWHLGHDDHDRRIIRGPECPPCNLKAAARKGARVAHGRREHRQRARRPGQSRPTVPPGW